MAVLVVLLRGVNVGGHGKVPMADLRALATDLGYDEPRTYIQSGNLVCTTSSSPATVARELEAGIAERFDVNTDVIVRTRAQLAKVVATNPFADRASEPKQLHVVFTAERARIGLDDLDRYAPEEVKAIGKELYLWLPNGMGTSKLAVDVFRKGPRGTARNWATVTKLLAMADEQA